MIIREHAPHASFDPDTISILGNDNLIAPDWSRYLSEHHISHFWSCESCGHRFETSDYLRLNTHRNEPLLLSREVKKQDPGRCRYAPREVGGVVEKRLPCT